MRKNPSDYEGREAFRKFLRAANNAPILPMPPRMRRNPSRGRSEIEPWMIPHLEEMVDDQVQRVWWADGRPFPLDMSLRESEIWDICSEYQGYYYLSKNEVNVLGAEEGHRLEYPLLAGRNPNAGMKVFTESWGPRAESWKSVVSNPAYDMAIMEHQEAALRPSVIGAMDSLDSYSNASGNVFRKYLWIFSRSFKRAVRERSYPTVRSDDDSPIGSMLRSVNSLFVVQERDLIYHARLIKRLGPYVEALIKSGDI